MSFFKRKKDSEPQFYATVADGLKKIYRGKLLPLEEAYDFHDFVSPALNDPDFDAKPMVLLVGQYSTGKTSFIRYLLERDYPGIRIGPEPTTDSFTAVMYGENEQVIPGNALAVDKNKQFRPLSKFGGAFLNRFQCSILKSPVLKCVTMVDTPGILSGEKQRTDRGYDFVGVLQWFAERVDRIILLFDANKLDISDEFRRSIEAIHGYEDKVRIVLNKADQVDHQELMRVYGALMWSISKVIHVPECPKVFVGSFWDQQLKHDLYRRLFEKELQSLFDDLQAGWPEMFEIPGSHWPRFVPWFETGQSLVDWSTLLASCSVWFKTKILYRNLLYKRDIKRLLGHIVHGSVLGTFYKVEKG